MRGESQWKEPDNFHQGLLACSWYLLQTERKRWTDPDTPGVNFINFQRAVFTLTDSEGAKRLTTWLSFCAFGIFVCKSCYLNIDEIDTWSQSIFIVYYSLTFFLFSKNILLKRLPIFWASLIRTVFLNLFIFKSRLKTIFKVTVSVKKNLFSIVYSAVCFSTQSTNNSRFCLNFVSNISFTYKSSI